MNQTSPFITGGATITVATLEPLVRWGLTGFHQPIPEAVPGVVAALLFTGAHALMNWFAARGAKTPQ
jgi:hypothetical protein